MTCQELELQEVAGVFIIGLGFVFLNKMTRTEPKTSLN
jgi:hypothetical protein